jgi:phosphoribosylaminoimidazole-succinocarboxamide synthase
MNTLTTFSTPQLRRLHRGKVRDSYRIDDRTRLIVVTDRISAFDKVLATPIPHKGAVLCGLTDFWFERTAGIVPNHVVRAVDPNITIVREAVPIMVEVVVRGYLTGSMWRAYEKGKRRFSGVTAPDALTKNARFREPLVTPTTKGAVDLEISPDEIVGRGLADQAVWTRMQSAALQLFAAGSEYLAQRGLLLVDTKYEFGLIDGELVVIDEMHTPDSSRIWPDEGYRRSPQAVESLDKEYVRAYLLAQAEPGPMPDTLPDAVVAETTRRYLELYERVTGRPLPVSDEDLRPRMVRNLAAAGVLRDGYVAIVMGSPADIDHARRIRDFLAAYDLLVDLRVVSAHKNGEEIVRMAGEYNDSVEPGAVVAIAGLSNGLGGALAANLNLPVFNCPPARDLSELQAWIHSSLLMPSRVPAATVVHPDNAALAAMRALNLPRLRERFTSEITSMKADLKEQDQRLRVSP